MANTSAEEVATMLRSVLSSEKNGIPMASLEREYKMLIGSRIPYRNLGFNSLESFLASLPDVVKLCRASAGDLMVKAVATESTLHVAQMVAGQKSTKSKPVMKLTYRHPTSKRRPGYRPMNVGYRTHKYERPPESCGYSSNRSGGARGVYQPRRSVTNTYGNKQYEDSGTSRKSELAPRFRKPRYDDRCSPDSMNGSSFSRANSHVKIPCQKPKMCDKDNSQWDTVRNEKSGDIWEEHKEDPGVNLHELNSEKVPSDIGNKGSCNWVAADPPKLGSPIVPPVTQTVTGREPKESVKSATLTSAEEEGAKLLSIEPTQPRFDPFREQIKLPGKSVTLPPKLPEREEKVAMLAASPEASLSGPLGALAATSNPSVTALTQSSVHASQQAQRRSRTEVLLADGPFEQLVANHAYRYGLTPQYRTCSSRSHKRGPLVWLATLTLDGHSYNSYPNERDTEAAAKEEAARKAVVALKLSKGTDPAFPVTPTGTPEDIFTLKERVAELVAARPCGLLNTFVPDLYRARFGQSLPDNWLEHMLTSSHVSFSQVDGNRCILYAHGAVPPEDGRAFAEPEPEHLVSSSQVDEYIDVFITCITATDSICFRFVEYAEEYDELVERMNKVYGCRMGRPAEKVEEEELYAFCANGEWLRVQATSPEENEQVAVTFVDRGDTATVNVVDLCELEEQFTTFPLQAIRCQLDGLQEYALCENASDLLVEMLLGRTLVAEVIQKQDPVIVVLYDTWTEVDRNLNLEIVFALATPCLPRPGYIGRAHLTHVEPSGSIFLQVSGPGLQSLVQAMDVVQQYYENNNDPVATLVAGKLYACRFGTDRTFYRAVLLSSEPELSGKFPVRYVDFGNTDSTFVADLRELDVFGSFVMNLPYQAVQCRLDRAPEPWTELCTDTLWNTLAGGTELLVKVVRPASGKEVASVALFCRLGPNKELVCINTQLHSREVS